MMISCRNSARRAGGDMTRPSSWAGIYPAALTMFDERGRLDDDATAAHFDHLIAEGAHGLVVGGSSGEFIWLSEEVRRRLLEVGFAANHVRVAAVVGIGWI